MSEAICCICRLPLFIPELPRGDWVDALRCGHVIHNSCRLGIGNGLCPCCRAQISQDPLRQPIKLFINFGTYGEETQMDQMLSLLQEIRTRINTTAPILQPRMPFNRNVIVPMVPTTPAESGREEREEHIVQVPFPWEHVRGQTRLNVEVKNNSLQICISRKRR